MCVFTLAHAYRAICSGTEVRPTLFSIEGNVSLLSGNNKENIK